MTEYNWKFLQTDTGKLSFCLCIGEREYRETADVGIAAHIQSSGDFDIVGPSIDEFLADSKKVIEAKMEGRKVFHKIKRTPSGEFRTLQRRLEKAELKAKRGF